MAATLLLAGLLTAAFGLVLALLLRPYLRSRRLSRISLAAPPPDWDNLLSRRMPHYRSMAPATRKRLLGQMQVFLHEKRFIGCAGLTVTNEMKVVIAAWASLMSLASRIPYPELQSILIYPDAFLVDKEVRDEAGVVSVGRAALIGESWDRHRVILSWADIEAGFARPGDNKNNVIVHEFAHQLDALDGVVAGSPPLGSAAEHTAWAEVFAAEYANLQARYQKDASDVIDDYGKTNPAEFFAVVAEAFFETPQKLRRDHAKLYGTLRQYFDVDPCEWSAEPESGSVMQ